MPKQPTHPEPRSTTVLDVPYPSKLRLRMILAFCFAMLLSIGIASMVRFVGKLPLPSAIISTSVLVFLVGLWYIKVGKRRVHEAGCFLAAKRIGSISPTDILEALGKTKHWQDTAALPEWVRAMAKAGHVGFALRLGPEDSFTELHPINFQFEPTVLDETDSGFRQLFSPSDHARESEEPASQDIDNFSIRRIRRNIRIKGGRMIWLAIAMIGLSVAFQMVAAVVQRRITPQLAYTTAILLFILFSTGRTPWKQFLAVPGGIVVRSAIRGGGWRVAMFDRASSMVCAYRNVGQQWVLIASDGIEVEKTIGTRNEVNFAMRAWLSELEPLPIERLSDLT